MARNRTQPQLHIQKRLDTNLLNHICLLRGFDVSTLVPDYKNQLHDPNLLPGMKAARAILRTAVEESWPVTIFGDYDADGTPAAALLYQVCRHLGLTTDVVLPTRQAGYGLHIDNIRDIAARSKLLITVDTGISSVKEIALAKELGLNVIVLDHHLPPRQLPPADAIIDPHLPESKYPFSDLCGCALAYKFACALGEDFPSITPTFCKWLLDLVAISTVADMMPLVGENRALVHYGLIVLRQNRRAGLKALLQQAGVDIGALSSTTLGFTIGPRLNASGRVNSNRPAFELLITDDALQAEQLALELEQANRLRQSLVETTLNEARELLLQQNSQDDRIFLIAKTDWPAGVVGLVAGKLSSEYNRPVIVGSIQDDLVRASARSIAKYPIVDGLTRHSSFLNSYGGHAQAAGLSADLNSWADFTHALKDDGQQFLTEEDFVKTYKIDAVLTRDDVTLKVANELEQLQPFGLGNSKPLLMLSDTEIQQASFIGSASKHLKLQLRSPFGLVDAIGFNLADRYKADPVTRGHFVGYLENNRWQGTERLQLQVVDFIPEDASLIEVG